MARLNLGKLNGQQDDAKSRVADAAKRKKDATESIEEAFERVGQSKFNDKERELFTVAKQAYFSGAIGRLDSGKLTKKEVLAMGQQAVKERDERRRKERIDETIRTKTSNYYVITDDSEIPRMVERLREEVRLQKSDEWFRKVFGLFNDTLIRRKLAERGINIAPVTSLTVWDTETSGTDTRIDMQGGYSLWLPVLNEGYYVAFGHTGGHDQCRRSKALDSIRKFIENPYHAKSFHNTTFDLEMFLNDGMAPKGFRYDSMDAQFILNDHEPSYGLKELVAKYKPYLNIDHLDDFTFEDLFGKSSPLPYDPEVVGIYAIKDVEKGWALTRFQIDMMCAKDDLYVPYFEMRQYIPEVNVEIERTGFCVDLDELNRLKSDYTRKLDEAKAELFKAYNIDDQFLRQMSLTINGDKIRKWCTAQQKRIDKQAEMLSKCRAELKKTNPSTKKYAQLKERIDRYETETLAEPVPENAPDYMHSFDFTPAQLQYLIYDKLGIKDRTKEVDKSKERSTAADVLDIYFEKEPSLKPLDTYTEYRKLLNTYVEKIPKSLDIDGRIHTSLRTVSTGRYSSSGYSGKDNRLADRTITDDNFIEVMRELVNAPKNVSKGTNLQNIPARSESGLRVRKTVVPAQDHTFIGSDLSSIEPRIQAHIMATEFNDHIFADMYRRGLDPYIEFASMMFDVDRELCEEKAYKDGRVSIPYRKLTKDMFLAKGYGQAEDQFVKTAVSRGIEEDAGRRAYRKFDEILPGFSGMVNAAFEHLREHGWTATIFGQKRRFPDYRENWRKLSRLMRKVGIRDKNDPDLAKKSYKLNPSDRTEFWDLIRKTGRDERAAFNHRIQGSGANILILCMIRSYYELTLSRGWEFNLTLHDEQKSSVPNDQLTSDVFDLYDDIMTNTVTLEVPLKCDTVVEPRWMEEYGRDEWDFENNRPVDGV